MRSEEKNGCVGGGWQPKGRPWLLRNKAGIRKKNFNWKGRRKMEESIEKCCLQRQGSKDKYKTESREELHKTEKLKVKYRNRQKGKTGGKESKRKRQKKK